MWVTNVRNYTSQKGESNMTKRDKDYIKSIINDKLPSMFEMFTWEDFINELGLTKKETTWAKEHLYPTVGED